METLATELRLPEYFGRNWDALEECIRDLSWLPRGPVVLVHEDVPLRPDAASLATYLSILQDAIAKWQNSPDHKFIVVFPSEAANSVRKALAREF